jgi:hypothetical protein
MMATSSIGAAVGTVVMGAMVANKPAFTPLLLVGLASATRRMSKASIG